MCHRISRLLSLLRMEHTFEAAPRTADNGHNFIKGPARPSIHGVRYFALTFPHVSSWRFNGGELEQPIPFQPMSTPPSPDPAHGEPGRSVNAGNDASQNGGGLTTGQKSGSNSKFPFVPAGLGHPENSWREFVASSFHVFVWVNSSVPPSQCTRFPRTAQQRIELSTFARASVSK